MKDLIKKSLIFVIALAVIASGFGFMADQAMAATGPTSITLKVASGTGTSAVVDINGKVKVYVSSVYPSTRSKAVTWSIYSGSSYGKISSFGGSYCYIQGIKTAAGKTYGTVIVKAKSKYYPYATKYIKVYVKQLYPTGVTLNRSSLSLWKGGTSTLKATVVKPSWVYSAGVYWTTNNGGIASVSSTGAVTAINPGATTIKAISNDKSTLRASCPISVYDAALTTSGRINMTVGDSDISNPVVFYGPAVSKTITYSSNNTSAVTVNSTTGVIHAVKEGSATITATVTIPSITAGSTTKTLTYVVNVKKPLGTDFDLSQSWAYLEITQSTAGYLQGANLMLSRSQLDDMFGYGSLGMNIWDPMDMYFNFQSKAIAWHAGDFSFDKTVQTNAALPDVEIVPDKSALVPMYHPYWLNDSTGDKNCVDLAIDSEGLVTGYDIFFYYDNTLTDYGNRITLNGNELTLQFEGSELKIVRDQTNRIKAYATVDAEGTLNDLVLTITRTTAGYHVVVNDTAYLANWGVEFNGFPTYL
jgi:uncharacterized protein YjdB